VNLKPKIRAYLGEFRVNFSGKKSAQRQKLSPKWRKFAQSGHTG
jgi:hypothetical protein